MQELLDHSWPMPISCPENAIAYFAPVISIFVPFFESTHDLIKTYGLKTIIGVVQY